MRALGSAIMLLTAAGFGQGAGPLAVGMLNDALKNDFGAQTVLLSAAVTATVGALLLIWAAGSVRGDFQRANWFDQRATPLPFVFITVFTKAHIAAAGFAVGQTICM